MRLSSILVITIVAGIFFWQYAPPVDRTITVGVPQEMYPVAIEGVQGWNATGEVEFIIQPTGCGTGDISFCYKEGNPQWAAWYDNREHQIYVSPAYTMIPMTVCHELAHSLGVTEHSDDVDSCLYGAVIPDGPASPTQEDVENFKRTLLPLPQQWLQRMRG